MKITVNRSLLIGIAILHSHIWIVLAEEIVKAINYTKDDDRRKEGQEDENKLQTLLSLFISSSFITTASSSRLFITETPYIAGTATVPDANPTSLLNASIQDSSIDEVSYHYTVHATASPLVDVPTSYLLNSQYLLESSYLLKNSFYLLDNTDSHDYSETDFHTVLASSSSSVSPLLSSLSSSLSLSSSSSSSSSSLILEDFDLSIQEDLHPYPEDIIQTSVSSSDITHAPSAESHILIMTSYEIPSSSNVIVYESTMTSDAIQNSNGQINNSFYSQIQHDHFSNFYSPYDGEAQFKENQPTVSLTEQINTDFSNFLIETSIIMPNNHGKESSTKHMLDLESQAATLHEISTSVREPLSIVTFNSSETRPSIDFLEEVNNSSNTYHHKIASDSKAMNNKTSRNEDAEIDEIISGIIHLLAGNVQVVRPTKNVLGMYPTRLHMPPPPALVSTRINNRGPIKPNGFSRTVVVFSQPPNKGNPTELALPGHLLPSTLQNHQFVRIRPTKIGDHPPSTMIHFYNQVLNPPQLVPQPNLPFPPPQHQIPFRGEVFNPNNRPNPNNKVRITVPPEEFVKPSFTSPEKQHSINGNPGNKYPHFIFSDNAASSVLVLRPSKPPPVETLINTHPDRHKIENSNYKNSSQNFEVLIDDTVKKKVFVSQMSPVSSNNFDVFNEKLTSYTPLTSDAVIFATKTKNIFPHGPVTDWVPFSERPSVRPNETNSFAEDSEVSIIMHPIIFDITVSNSVGEIDYSKNTTLNEDNTSITITDIETHSTFLNSASGTTEQYLPSDTEFLTISTKIFNKEYLQDDSELISSKILMNDATPISEIRSLISKTTDAFSSPTIDVTSYYTTNSITNPLTITPNFDLRSSYNQGNSYTESETVTESTENLEVPSRLSSLTISSSIFGTFSIENTSNPFNINSKSSIPNISRASSISNLSNIPRASSIPNISRTSSVLTISSTSTIHKKSTLTPTQTNEPTLIGRPIVIPVDIEEVRPFVGPINPLNQDQNRENQYQRPFPKDQGSTTENIYRTISSTTTRTPIIRSQQRPRPNTVRIDTCIVGDDSTCDITLNETCKTEMGISSCHCRPGYARSYARGPCIPIVSLMLSMKVDRFGNKKMAFSPKYLDKNSEDYRLMEFESKLALSSLISQIPAFARTFLGLQINTFYPIGDKIVINSTIFLEEKESTRTQAVRLRLRQLIGEAIKNKKQNIGDSRLFVEGSYSPVTAIEDVNECSDVNLNDCSSEGMCFNVFGTYLCKCKSGYVDPFIHDERRSGRKCSACSPEYCSFHGKCFVERDKRLCKCHGNYIGSRCEIDGEVLGVALGASLAAIIIILLTLGCLCIWNRKWKQQQQKAEVLSSRSYNSNQTFSYVGNMMNSNTNPYHLTMEDRMRWAQISDVIKNASMQPNPDHPYLSPTPAPLEQANFSNRCQPTEDEMSWYESRNRQRPRVPGQYPGVSAPSCFEMDIPVRPPYAAAGYLSSKRPKHHPTIPTIRY